MTARAKDTEIPKVSTTNTKKEILEAYSALKEKFEQQAKAAIEPEKVRQTKIKEEVVREADKLASENVVQQIGSLKLEMAKALDDTGQKLADEAERYRKIKSAIAAKTKEFEEIFEIEKSAHTLAALIEAQKIKKIDFESEAANTRAEWEVEKRRHEEAVKEQRIQEEKQRKREKEEYEYSYKREKELKTQEMKDHLAALEKELLQRKEAFEKEMAEKEDALLQRDVAVSERERHMEELEKRVKAFPAELEAAVQKAMKAATDRMREEAQKNETLLMKGTEGEKNVLTTKIEALESTVAAQRKQIDLLTQQLDNAYAKVQDIAVKAVSKERPVSVMSGSSRESGS